MNLFAQIQSIANVEPAVTAPSVTDWAQTIVTIVGIIIAAWVAVRVAARQHDRQVLHQTRKDVADALVVLEDLKQEFFNVKTLAELSGDQPVDSQTLSESMKNIVGGVGKLESAVRLLQLTAPQLIFSNAKNVRHEALKLKNLTMRTLSAHLRVHLLQSQGVVEPLGPVTSESAYTRQAAALDDAESRLVVATMDYEMFTSPTQQLRIRFNSLWLRIERFARRRMSS
ncbi:hypothetical protein [Paenarthrobacter sp. A20]|uniref:hypothetical protein n=1 Tax=Paenarthrobacter sp. A20 TaxID=2817891 RepID=UPI0020A0C7D9|nr:hypothetical protein [Paenarthrobacter sp. A20]MCP1415718.1 hypothetical protein [Paenarthrobacter sp. A20]